MVGTPWIPGEGCHPGSRQFGKHIVHGAELKSPEVLETHAYVDEQFPGKDLEVLEMIKSKNHERPRLSDFLD